MKPVLALAALLLVAVVGLVVWISRGDEPPETKPAPVATKPPETTPESPIVAAPPSEERKRELDQIAGNSAATDPRKPPSTYAVGDTVVHDRRAGGGEPRNAPARPPGGTPISAKVATEVTNVMAPAAKQCISALPAESRNEKTKLNVTMTVTVKNGSLTVSDVAAKVDGVDDSGLAPALACLRQQMVGSTVAAAGEPDMDAYPITTWYTQ